MDFEVGDWVRFQWGEESVCTRVLGFTGGNRPVVCHPDLMGLKIILEEWEFVSSKNDPVHFVGAGI